jgi:hypothetical protein
LRPTLMRLTSNLHHPNDQNIVGKVELDLAVALKVEFFSHYGICCDRLGIMHDCEGPMPDPRRYGELVPGASTKDDAIRGPFTAVPALSTLTSTSARNLKVE